MIQTGSTSINFFRLPTHEAEMLPHAFITFQRELKRAKHVFQVVREFGFRVCAHQRGKNVLILESNTRPTFEEIEKAMQGLISRTLTT